MRKFKTLEWVGQTDGFLRLTDQRRLPREFVKLDCKRTEDLFEAIQTLAVRGAPAIGVAAGFGVCIAAQELDDNTNAKDSAEYLNKRIDYLATSRPTAVNLFWALERMRNVMQKFTAENRNGDICGLREVLLAEAKAVYDEDVEMCRKIGEYGEKFIPSGGSVLTHCNAGAPATAGTGTALGPMFAAAENGKGFKVYVDETRPLLQGARLTAWELIQSGIKAVLICDNTPGPQVPGLNNLITSVMELLYCWRFRTPRARYLG